jgi:hypothetical protein
MPSEMEKILGPIGRKRRVPGTGEGESEIVRYVSWHGDDPPSEQFRRVTRQVDPPIVRGGGVVLEGCRIRAPDGVVYYPLCYHGDIAGWQEQIQRGASELGLATARIAGDDFVISDGRVFRLSDCQIDFV